MACLAQETSGCTTRVSSIVLEVNKFGQRRINVIACPCKREGTSSHQTIAPKIHHMHAFGVPDVRFKPQFVILPMS